jgi:hypothetical protein
MNRGSTWRAYGKTDGYDQLAALEGSFGAWRSGEEGESREDGATSVDRMRRRMTHRASTTDG